MEGSEGRVARWKPLLIALVILCALAWPRVGWVSGAMSASGLARHYTLSVAELSYAFGETPPPSAAFYEAEARAWRDRLARVMTVTDRWLASEQKSGAIASVEIGLATAMPEDPRPGTAGGSLRRATLVALPPCNMSSRNLGVVVKLALLALPPPAERAALGKRLCTLLTNENLDVTPALPLAAVGELKGDREGLALTLTGDFHAPADRLAELTQSRAAFFEKAALAMLESSRRFQAAHRGVTLHRPGKAEGTLVRYFSHTPIGGFDVLTTVAVAPGAKAPSEVELKDAFYRDWIAAGLPVQVELRSLMGASPRSHD